MSTDPIIVCIHNEEVFANSIDCNDNSRHRFMDYVCKCRRTISLLSCVLRGRTNTSLCSWPIVVQYISLERTYIHICINNMN